MQADLISQLVGIHKEMVVKVLDIGQCTLHPHQFKAFKKMVLGAFHQETKPRIIEAIRHSDQVRAVPLTDNLDGKEADHEL